MARYERITDVYGLLRDETLGLRGRLKKLLYRHGNGGDELEKRVRLSLPQRRTADEPTFRKVLTALVRRRRLSMHYHGRARDERSARMVSPRYPTGTSPRS